VSKLKEKILDSMTENYRRGSAGFPATPMEMIDGIMLEIAKHSESTTNLLRDIEWDHYGRCSYCGFPKLDIETKKHMCLLHEIIHEPKGRDDGNM